LSSVSPFARKLNENGHPLSAGAKDRTSSLQHFASFSFERFHGNAIRSDLIFAAGE
jgi:hypothetical protein